MWRGPVLLRQVDAGKANARFLGTPRVTVQRTAAMRYSQHGMLSPFPDEQVTQKGRARVDSAGTHAAVLLVEDDADIRDAFTLLLSDEGYQPTAVSSPEEALRLVDLSSYNLILTDLFFHTSHNPLGAVTVLKERAHPTPVAVATAWKVDEAEVARQGLAFLIVMPFDIDHLLSGIAAAIHTTLSPLQERQAQVVRRYFDALTAKDWDTLMALCTDDIVYVLPGNTPFSTVINGKAAFRAYTEETFRHFTAARFDTVSVYATPAGLAARYNGTWLLPDGAEAHLTGSVSFRFEDEAIAQIGVKLNDERLRALIGSANDLPSSQ